jgi:hypothetical protein
MPLRYRKRLSLATLTRTSGVKQREDKNEARTGTAAAVAAAGGKIVAAGDTLGRPGRAGNRTSLEVGTTITLEKSQGRGMRKKNLKQRDRGKLKVLGWRRVDPTPKQIGRPGRMPKPRTAPYVRIRPQR